MPNTHKVSSESKLEWVHWDSMANKNHIPAKCLQDSNSSEDTQHRDLRGKLTHLKCLEEIHCYLPTTWPSAHLALFSKLWRYSHSNAILTPAISPITGRLVEGASVLFLQAQVETTGPLPPKKVTSANKLYWSTLHSKSTPQSGRISQNMVSNTQNLPSGFNYCWV